MSEMAADQSCSSLGTGCTTSTGTSSCRDLEKCIERAVSKAVNNSKRDLSLLKHEKTDHGVRLSLRLFKIAGVVVGVVANLEVQPRVEISLATLSSSKRRRYSGKEKAIIVESAEATSAAEAAAAIRKREGYGSIRKQQIEKWAVPKVPKKVGRPYNDGFRAAVLDRLVYTSVEQIDNVERLVIKANVVYSYPIIEQAARLEQKSERWASDDKVLKLKFTHPWIVKFLEKSGLNRRRVTNIEKQLPPVDVVDKRMQEIQGAIVEKGYTLAQILNSDETGIFYGEKPKNQYVPSDAMRASTPETDDKARFTAMLFGSSAGEMGKTYSIVKCSSKNKTSLMGTRVLQNLAAADPYFSEAGGWKLLQWSRSLTLKGKKGQFETNTYTRPLLKHTDGSVITLQLKAWMDSVGIAMWCDCLLGPHVRDRCGGKACMIWDNCGSHNSPAIQSVFESWGIEILSLPPKMTDHLQIMDLVVNAPLKASIRRMRVQNLFDYFQAWKIRRLQDELRPASERSYPSFDPPKPTQAQGLKSLIVTVATALATPKFQESMARSFVEACQAPKPDGTFVRYTNHRRGTVVQGVAADAMYASGRPKDDTLAAGLADTEMRAEAQTEREQETEHADGSSSESEEDGDGPD